MSTPNHRHIYTLWGILEVNRIERQGRNIQISSCDIVVKHGHIIINIEAPRIVFTQMIFIVMFTEPLLSTSSLDTNHRLTQADVEILCWSWVAQPTVSP